MNDSYCRYEAENVGSVRTDNKSGVYIDFENTVEEKRTQYQITFITLLTRFGGVVGVWKNLLWVIIFTMTSLAGAVRLLKTCLL